MDGTFKSDFDIRSYLRVFQRRKLLFLLVFLSVSASVFVGSWMREEPAITPPPSYLSTTEILVTPPAPGDVPDEAESLNTWFANEKLFKQLIVSEEVLTRVHKRLKGSITLEELQGSITVDSPEQGDNLVNLWDSFLVKISVETMTQEESQKIAEVLVEEVIEYTQQLAAREVIASRKALEKMALSNKKAMEQAQRRIIEWRKQNDVWDIDQLVETQGARIAELEASREEQVQRLLEERKRLTELSSYQDGSESLPWEVVSLKSSELSKHSEDRDRLQTELEQLRKVFTDSNDRVQAKLEEYRQADNAYQRERRSLVDSLVRSQAATVAEAEAKVRMTDESLRQLKNDQSLADSQVELQQLQNELENHKLNLQSLTDQINEAQVQEQRQRHLAAFTVVQKPGPGVPISVTMPETKELQTKLGAVCMGLLAAVLVCYGAEFFAVGFRLRPRVEKTLGLPILGSLPSLSAQDASKASVVQESPEALVSERFRSIVVNLMRKEHKINRVLVSSCWAGEGKSFVSINLAAALARFDLKVTLLDGDLRRPRLSRDLEREDEPGFRQFLRGELPAEELAVSTEVKNLSFLPAGTGSGNPSELLAQLTSLSPLAGEQDGRFLVVDSPPLSVCSDTVQMSDQVDGVILVISSQHWQGEAELEHVLSLEDQGVKILGLVLNRVNEEELHYGYKSYLNRYYQTEEKKSSKLLFWK